MDDHIKSYDRMDKLLEIEEQLRQVNTTKAAERGYVQLLGVNVPYSTYAQAYAQVCTSVALMQMVQQQTQTVQDISDLQLNMCDLVRAAEKNVENVQVDERLEKLESTVSGILFDCEDDGK